MTNPILKNNIKTISLCFIALFIISQRTSAQNSMLGFKNAEKQNKKLVLSLISSQLKSVM